MRLETENLEFRIYPDGTGYLVILNNQPVRSIVFCAEVGSVYFSSHSSLYLSLFGWGVELDITEYHTHTNFSIALLPPATKKTLMYEVKVERKSWGLPKLAFY